MIAHGVCPRVRPPIDHEITIVKGCIPLRDGPVLPVVGHVERPPAEDLILEAGARLWRGVWFISWAPALHTDNMLPIMITMGLMMPLIVFIVDWLTYRPDFDPFFPTPCMFRRKHFGMHSCYYGLSFALLFHVKTVVAYQTGSPGILAGVELLLLFSNLGFLYSKESHDLSVWLIQLCFAVQLTSVLPLIALGYVICALFVLILLQYLHVSNGNRYSSVRSMGLFLITAIYFLFHLAYLIPVQRRAYSEGREILEVWLGGGLAVSQTLFVLFFDVYMAHRNDVGTTHQGPRDCSAGGGGPNGEPSEFVGDEVAHV